MYKFEIFEPGSALRSLYENISKLSDACFSLLYFSFLPVLETGQRLLGFYLFYAKNAFHLVVALMVLEKSFLGEIAG